MKSIEQQLHEKEQELSELRKTLSRTALTQELRESGLPEAAQNRLRKRFKGSETAGEIKALIDGEKDYIRQVRSSGWSRKAASEAVDLVESYRRLGLSAKEAAIASGVEAEVENISESRIRLRDAFKLLGMSEEQADAASQI